MTIFSSLPLDSYHTFSFGGYYDPQFSAGFGPLIVINEDFVQPQRGFGKHSHREAEIFSYIVRGELEHQDSMGNLEKLHRGDVQFTSAGTGISHSEYNRHSKETVHFIQMWVLPNKMRLQPRYDTVKFDDAEKRGRLRPIVSMDAREGSIRISQDFVLFASILENGEKVTLAASSGRKYYVHVIMTGRAKTGVVLDIAASDGATMQLEEGDGAFIDDVSDGTHLQLSSGASCVEFLLFDIIKM